MSTEQNELSRAKAFIKAKRYEDARAILITLDDPKAEQLLERMEQRGLLKTSEELELQRMLGNLGEAVPSEVIPTSLKRTQIAGKEQGIKLLLIWLFLGLFGGHRFYTGHTRIGLLQLVTLGGFFIWWIIDGILILTGLYQDSEGNVIKVF